MTSSGLLRRAALAAFGASAIWFLLSVASVAEPDPERYLDALIIGPIILTFIAVAAIHTLQRAAAGRLGQIGFWTLGAGTVIAVVVQIAIVASDDARTGPVVLAGLIVWLAGLVIYGIATARAGVLPVWSGILIATSQLFAVAGGLALSPFSSLTNDGGDYSGAVGHAIVWFVIGRVLWTRLHTTSLIEGTEQASLPGQADPA